MAAGKSEMKEFFEELDGLAPDEGFLKLEEVFYLK
jgi:L-rhamnose mutarotase